LVVRADCINRSGFMPEPFQERYLALKAVMMPRDTNPHGTIFGGVLLSYIDQAGAVGARHSIAQSGWPDHTLVTVGMKSVEFHEPVFVGDLVSFWTETLAVGRTSITMHVVVESERKRQTLKLTEAEVTYVAVEAGIEPGVEPRCAVPIRGQDVDRASAASRAAPAGARSDRKRAKRSR
jgi:acyl-CoA thioesterase YciA